VLVVVHGRRDMIGEVNADQSDLQHDSANALNRTRPGGRKQTKTNQEDGIKCGNKLSLYHQ
jgi:hypothetical protein